MSMKVANILMGTAFLFYASSMVGYIAYLVKQQDRVQKLSFVLMLIAVLIHITGITYIGIKIGGLPINNMHQNLSIAGLALGLMFLFFQFRFNLKILGLFASTTLSLLMLVVIFLPHTPAQSDRLLTGIWFYGHIVLIFLGEGALALAAGASIFYLVQEKGIKGKTPGFFFRRLPSLDFLDDVSSACVETGFTLLTFGLIIGFIYAKAVWGRFWGWDIKEIFSIITWMIYAAILHFRFHAGWRGQKSAIMTILGFLIMVFTFIGVNQILGGHHQSFTK